MKKTLFLLISFILLPSLSYATITYDNGQYNYITTFINDDVLVLDSVGFQPTSIDIQPSGNIFHTVWVYGSSSIILNGGSIGDFGRDVNAYGNSHVEILSGTAGRVLNLNGSSTATIWDGSVKSSVYTYDDSMLTVNGGNIGADSRDLVIAGSSKVYLNNGTIGRYLRVCNDAILEMKGGNVNYITTLNNNAKFVMTGGNLGYHLYVEDTSVFEMSGGWVDTMMYARHDAEITIIGTDFNYPLGYITDSSGTITGTLANGDPINVPFIIEGNGVILLKDPEVSLTVIAPNGGDRYLTDKHVEIEYVTEGDTAIETVDIEYSSDNGSSWFTVATGISNTGIYEWTTPSIESENFIIRVSSSDNPTITDTSDNTFIIFSCAEINPADLNSDCYVNLADFVLFAESWLWCRDRYNPECSF